MQERERAETALAEAGITPERVGEADYELAIRETVDHLARSGTTGAGSRSRISPPTLPVSRARRTSTTTMTTLGEAMAPLRLRLESAQEERLAVAREAPPAPDRGPDCPHCGGARFVRSAPLQRTSTRGVILEGMPKAMAANVEPCECSIAWTDAQLADNGVPEPRRTWTFDTFPAAAGKRDAMRATRQWVEAAAERSQAQLVLWGEQPGVGKTGLAIAAVHALNAQRKRARFLPMQDLLRRMQSLFGDGDGAREYEDRLQREPILVLDDVGAEQKSRSGWSAEVLEALLEARTAYDRPTLLTTNLSPAELSTHVEARAADRLKLFEFAHVGGSSLRGRAS